MSFTKLGWANKAIIGYSFLLEQDEEIKQSTPPAPSAELSQDAIIGPMLKFIHQKMLAYIKKSQEEGKAAKLTPYRDRSIYFLQFIKDNFPELVNNKLAEIEKKKPREKREGAQDVTPIDAEGIVQKKRIPSATEINWWFGNTLRSLPNGREVYDKVKNELIAKTDNKSIQDYINVTATTRGERFKIDAGSFLPTSDITTALATPLSAFKSPEERFEQQITDEPRVSLEEIKDFLIQALVAFKEDEKGDPYISDEVNDVISGVYGNETAEDLEGYVTSKARKYNKLAQRGGDAGAKKLYEILSDIIENFTHFKLFGVLRTTPETSDIALGSIQDIKDDVVYGIEDFKENNEEFAASFDKMIAKIENMDTISEILTYLEGRIEVLPTHSNPTIQRFAKKLESIYNSIKNKISTAKKLKSDELSAVVSPSSEIKSKVELSTPSEEDVANSWKKNEAFVTNLFNILRTSGGSYQAAKSKIADMSSDRTKPKRNERGEVELDDNGNPIEVPVKKNKIAVEMLAWLNNISSKIDDAGSIITNLFTRSYNEQEFYENGSSPERWITYSKFDTGSGDYINTESVKITPKQVNNLLVENYRNSIRKKVIAQQRYLY